MSKKLIYLGLGLLVINLLLLPAFVLAQGNVDFGLNLAGNVGLGQRDPTLIATAIIRILLGFLGLVAVVVVLIGGFKWMTAMGNEDKVGEAKKLLLAGIIGLIIIITAFALANYVISTISNVAR